jgi:hypothetical protein
MSLSLGAPILKIHGWRFGCLKWIIASWTNEE